MFYLNSAEYVCILKMLKHLQHFEIVTIDVYKILANRFASLQFFESSSNVDFTKPYL